MFSKKGSALIFSFWALIFLIFMSYGIARRVNAKMFLAKHQLGKARTKYTAIGGLFYVIDELQRDLNNIEASARGDTVFNCGLALQPGKTPEDIFSDVSLGEATFSVGYGEEPKRFGLIDESAKINLNGMTEQNYGMLKELLILNDVDREEAEVIASSVVDWKDSNDTVFQENYVAEDEYYMSLANPYRCKNSFFETTTELMFVKGMTFEIFKKIKPHITVYPYSETLKINFNTASEMVLLALARSAADSHPGVSELDVPSFVEKIISARNGKDGKWGTEDDELIDLGKISFNNGPEQALKAALMSVSSSKAAVVRAYIQATDERTGIKSLLDAVIETDTLKVVSLNIQ